MAQDKWANKMSLGKIYLIPNVLQDDEEALRAIPPYILEAIKDCRIFFTENEKKARRFFKRIWKEMVIDDYQWYAIHKAEEPVRESFVSHVKAGYNVGIISDAGCPGIADPGQLLIAEAQKLGAVIHPMVGPNSIILALMASGMNGQHFQFHGYLPVTGPERKAMIRHLEEESAKKDCTQLFIETPYRNQALLSDLLQTCKPHTRLCIAVDITAATESIRTMDIQDWKKGLPGIHKRPAIFLLLSR